MGKTGSIQITQNSQSIANNTSSITVKGIITTSEESYRGDHRTGTITVTQGGTVIYSGSFTSGAPLNSTTTLFSINLTVTHNSDGTSGTITASYNYDSGWCTATGSTVLSTIPRKSTLSGSNGTLNTAQTLTVTRQSTSFTHTITYACGSASGTLCTKSSATSVSWTPPLSLASQNTKGTSVTVTFTITTYNGSTSLGSSTKSLAYAIPTSLVPSLSISISDAAGYLSTYGAYVQGKSKVKVAITASGTYGSTIAAYKTTVDGKSYSSSSVTTDVISSNGTLTVTTTVTDTRGRTKTVTASISVLAYTAPSISAMKIYRCDSTGQSISSGTYLGVQFSAEISPLSNGNTATYSLQYKKSSATSYTSKTLTEYSGNYSIENGLTVFQADTASSYDVILTITDAFGSTNKAGVGSSIKKLWSMLTKGLGFAFGKVAEYEGLEVDMNARFLQDLFVKKTDGTFLNVLATLLSHTTSITNLGTMTEALESDATWKSCTVTANTSMGNFYNNSQSAKYRYDNNVLEICVRGTYVAKTTIAKGATLMTVSGLDIAIPISQAVMLWDETSQTWRRVSMDTAGAITLASNTSISSGAWLSGTTLDFKMFRK